MGDLTIADDTDNTDSELQVVEKETGVTNTNLWLE